MYQHSKNLAHIPNDLDVDEININFIYSAVGLKRPEALTQYYTFSPGLRIAAKN